MAAPLRRYLSVGLRKRRWAIFLLGGAFMLTLSVLMAAAILLVVAPANLETLHSFPAGGLAATAVTALLISLYWFHLGFRTAFRSLSVSDQEATERLRALMFRRRGEPGVVELPNRRLVSLGGGTGLSTLLKGLKGFPLDLTAIVTVTDDGGSSGQLRKELQILPPGDIRNCLVALASSESLLSRLFQYRFSEVGGFTGHSFGNLFIAAMTGVLGDFNSAVREASNILAIRGAVVPVTCDNVQLSAKFADGSEVVGETAISAAGKRIVDIRLSAERPLANPDALRAIDLADLLVLGPGSLFTSVIPNLLIPDIAERINRSRATVVYVCNVMTQPGETDGFTAADHVAALISRTPLQKIDVVVVNSRRAARPLLLKYEAKGAFWVPPTVTRIEEMNIRVVSGDFLTETDMVRHDPVALAKVILELAHERIGEPLGA